MNIEVLVSTMNLDNVQKLIKKMKIKNGIIINQTEKEKVINQKCDKIKVLSYIEKGLSKSRNRAISNSSADIIVIADDDMTYSENYEEIILSAYEKYKDADIVAFHVNSNDKKRGKKIRKESKINFLNSMKIQSVQLTMKRKNIVENNLLFNENFGAGSKWFMGEENIFLFNCLKRGLKIYYIPKTIASLDNSDSTWFKGFDKEYFIVKGGVFYEMSKLFSEIFILQFALRKRKLFGDNLNVIQAIKFMNQGRKKRKNESKQI